MTELPQPQFIRLDLFPAQVTLNTSLMQQEFRTIVTDDTFYLFVDGEHGPAIFHKESLLEFEGNNRVGYTITTETGVFIAVRASSCGCGSRLRGFFPFPGVPFIKQN